MKIGSYMHKKRLIKEAVYKKKLIKLANRIAYFPSGAYITRNDDGVEYIKRYYRGNNSKYLKKVSNRKVRRYNDEIKSGSSYRKVFDYWWALY